MNGLPAQTYHLSLFHRPCQPELEEGTTGLAANDLISLARCKVARVLGSTRSG